MPVLTRAREDGHVARSAAFETSRREMTVGRFQSLVETSQRTGQALEELLPEGFLPKGVLPKDAKVLSLDEARASWGQGNMPDSVVKLGVDVLTRDMGVSTSGRSVVDREGKTTEIDEKSFAKLNSGKAQREVRKAGKGPVVVGVGVGDGWTNLEKWLTVDASRKPTESFKIAFKRVEADQETAARSTMRG
jgi:hypothetical protein